MPAISSSVATTAGTYCSFVILTIVCIYDFTAPVSRLPVNLTYGVTLVILSLINLLLGLTSQDHGECVLRAFQLCSSCMWGAIGVYHITETLTPKLLTDTEALFGGYSAFVLIFLLLVIGGLLHKTKFAAVISLGYVLSCIFEIASLWRPLRASAAAYYILLAALTLYYSIQNVLRRYRQGSNREVPESSEKGVSKDYIILGHAMNTLSFAIYAGHLTGIYSGAHKEFHWVLVAGLFQCIAGLVAVRRNSAFNGGYFLIHGIFWLSNGYNLAVEHVTEITVYPLIAVSVLLIITFTLIALAAITKELFQVLQNLSLAVFCAALAVNGSHGKFLGGIACVSFILSLYGLMAHITRMKSGCKKLPLGSELFETERMKQIIADKYRIFAGCLYGQLSEVGKGSALFSTSHMLGYSKYLELDMVGFAVNAVSALAILWVPKGLVILPWVILFGGIPQFIVGSVSFSRGLTFESCAFFMLGSMWTIWGSVKGLGVLDVDHSIAAAAGCIAFIAIGLLLLGLATVISVSWVILIILYILLVVGFLLQTLSVSGIDVYLVVISIAFAVVCIYCFLASVTKSLVGRSSLPTGKPIVQVSYLHSQGDKALWCDARRASGVKQIAEILNNGGICGVPTDVVYILAAALKFPKAVQRAYETKKLAEDRPMSMWISKREQLSAGKEEFGELLWDLMQEVWPSTISLVIKKGPWVQSLGVDFAEKYIGRADSIAVRMPDNTVTSHLIDQVGPISVSSANPTGEADTTHHLQVLAKLGVRNCDGILCAGPSPENAASTVVDCREINEGKLGFFRIGIVPKSRVEELFEKVRSRHMFKSDIPAAISHHSDNSSDSGVCGSDKSDKSDKCDKKGTDDESSVTVDIEDGGQVNRAFEDNEDTCMVKEKKSKHVDINGGVTTIYITKNKRQSSDESGCISLGDSDITQNSEKTFERQYDFEKEQGDLTTDSGRSPRNLGIEPVYKNQPLSQTSSESKIVQSQPHAESSLTENGQMNQPILKLASSPMVKAAHEIGGRPSPSLSVRHNPVYNDDQEINQK